MRMGGEIAYRKEEEKEKEVTKDRELEEEKMVARMRYSAIGGGFSSPPSTMKVVVVGYALTSKKIKSFLQPKLEGLARNKGILFVAIDLSKPLSDQGPFDIVLHKLSGKEWRCILENRIIHVGGIDCACILCEWCTNTHLPRVLCSSVHHE